MGDTRGAIVVTGSSSGIGRACALALHRAGFRVYAGVRKDKDAEALRALASPALTPLFLDITNDQQIATAVRTVLADVGDAGLAGLVNNAGVGFLGPLEFLPLEHLQQELAINVTGQLAVTQAFLPAIRRARGRIVNIGSIAGKIALPFAGAIAVSKHGMEALNDVLRMELAPWGVHVIMVRPGLIRTEAPEKAYPIAQKMVEDLPPEGKTYFEAILRKFNETFIATNRAGSPPEVIAAVVLKALTTARPSLHYSAGKEAFKGLFAASTLPDRILDRVRKGFAGLPVKFGGL